MVRFVQVSIIHWQLQECLWHTIALVKGIIWLELYVKHHHLMAVKVFFWQHLDTFYPT
jgi:hypothetical protein